MNDFEKLVFEMRNAQKEYFKHRSPRALQDSKKLEQKVDYALAWYQFPKLEL